MLLNEAEKTKEVRIATWRHFLISLPQSDVLCNGKTTVTERMTISEGLWVSE